MTVEAGKPSKPCPAGLGSAARRLWRDVTGVYELRPDELILLETACRTLETIVALEAALIGQPLTTTGSMGQRREHPLLSEARQQRSVLVRILSQLKLPDVDEAVASRRGMTRSVQARAAARGAVGLMARVRRQPAETAAYDAGAHWRVHRFENRPDPENCSACRVDADRDAELRDRRRRLAGNNYSEGKDTA